jgi:hypothetical protein
MRAIGPGNSARLLRHQRAEGLRDSASVARAFEFLGRDIACAVAQHNFGERGGTRTLDPMIKRKMFLNFRQGFQQRRVQSQRP